MKKIYAYLTLIQAVMASSLGFIAIMLSNNALSDKLVYSAIILVFQAVVTGIFYYANSEKNNGVAYKCPNCKVTFYSVEYPNRCPNCACQLQQPNYGDFGNPIIKNEEKKS